MTRSLVHWVGSRIGVHKVIWAAAAIVVFWFDCTHHEFWRDEAQTMLIGRSEPLVAPLLRTCRLEGVPPLMFLVTKVTNALLPTPYSLALIGAVGYFFLLYATYRALTFVSGNPRVSAIVATLFGATYLYSCEYGIIVRQYGFGLGFALMAFAYLGSSLQTPDVRNERKGAAFAALAALTSAHPACLAGSALFAFTAAGALRRKTIKVVVPGLLALPAYLVLFWIISPNADRMPQPPKTVHSFEAFFKQCTVILHYALGELGWWGTLPRPVLETTGTIGVIAVVGGLALAACRLLFDWTTTLYVLIVLALNSAAINYILLYNDSGQRHHGFFIVPLVLCLVGFAIWASRQQWPLQLLGGLVAVLFIPFFGMEIDSALVMVGHDHDELFSGTQRAAWAMPEAPYIASDTDLLTALMYWRPQARMWSTKSNGRELKYVYIDREWPLVVPFGTVVKRACDASAGTIYSATWGGVDSRTSECGSLVLAREPALEEPVEVWRVDCSCFLSKL